MAKKLKDVNNDGKVNFKDTWLGEKLLGGGKTKGPNLKESMAGARRESSAAPMKSPVPKDKPATKASTTPATSPKPKPDSALSGASRSTAGKVKDPKTTPVRLGGTPATGPVAKKPKSSVPMPARNMSPTPDKGPGVTNSPRTRARMGSVTKEEYDAMSPAQRKAKGLPLTWTDRIFSPSSNFKDSKKGLLDIKNADAVMGMSKGGMTKKGKC